MTKSKKLMKKLKLKLHSVKDAVLSKKGIVAASILVLAVGSCVGMKSYLTPSIKVGSCYSANKENAMPFLIMDQGKKFTVIFTPIFPMPIVVDKVGLQSALEAGNVKQIPCPKK